MLRRFYGENCDTDAIIEALHAQAEKAFQAPPPKKPGLDEILTWLDAQHIPMAVASSSRMASIRHHLDGWGLTHYFKVIVSGEQFSASKQNFVQSGLFGRRCRRVLRPVRGAGWAAEGKVLIVKIQCRTARRLSGIVLF